MRISLVLLTLALLLSGCVIHLEADIFLPKLTPGALDGGPVSPLATATVTPIPLEVEAMAICAIKGIAGPGYVGIFYEPLDPEYPDITVNEARGDRWFCSVQDALMWGWEPAP